MPLSVMNTNNKNQKKVLVIGAAESCLGIIKAIKRLGYKSIVVGSNKDMPGASIADYYCLANDGDVEAVVTFCSQVGVDAIVPTPVDRTLLWMANVAERFNLIFLSVAAVENFRNKHRMKLCLQNAGISCARGILMSKEDFSSLQLKDFSFPLIVKPIDAYASRGVLKVENLIELEMYIDEASSFSSNGQVVIEEFIDGREFNAEGVCFNGVVEIYAIVEKIRDPFPRTVEMGHIVPPDISMLEENIIIDTITKGVIALGMENGSFNAEIKIHDNKGFVIEINGRLAGDFIISHLLKPTTGQDMEEATVNIALGLKPPKALRKYLRHGLIRFFNLPAGRKIKEIKDFSHLQENPDIIWAHLFFKKDDTIPEVLHMGHRSGFVIVTANNRSELFKLADWTIDEVIKSTSYH
jgi:biotin carboxylase